jgi:hypothetical protein
MQGNVPNNAANSVAGGGAAATAAAHEVIWGQSGEVVTVVRVPPECGSFEFVRDVDGSFVMTGRRQTIAQQQANFEAERKQAGTIRQREEDPKAQEQQGETYASGWFNTTHRFLRMNGSKTGPCGACIDCGVLPSYFSACPSREIGPDDVDHTQIITDNRLPIGMGTTTWLKSSHQYMKRNKVPVSKECSNCLEPLEEHRYRTCNQVKKSLAYNFEAHP